MNGPIDIAAALATSTLIGPTRSAVVGDHPGHGRGIGDVADHGETADPLSQCGQPAVVDDVVHGDREPVRRQPLGRGVPESLRGAGDKCDCHVRSPPLRWVRGPRRSTASLRSRGSSTAPAISSGVTSRPSGRVAR